MKIFQNLKSYGDGPGMTLAEVAERAGYSVGAVQGLEKHNKGARRLRETVMRVLNERLMGHISGRPGRGCRRGTAEEKNRCLSER